ncbi:hypothetical protein PybrP1_001816 [[Pythium] brassicae (nom. inval.)]|nr:hypothetical protein PybrP1_001816 [[Pythium] brassicae (nom. inval.)]
MVAGAKLAPLLIWKGAAQGVKRFGGVYVAQQPRAWFTIELLLKWVDNMYPVLMDSCGGRGLVWDAIRLTSRRTQVEVREQDGRDASILRRAHTRHRHLQVVQKSTVARVQRVEGLRVQYTKAGNPRRSSFEEVPALAATSRRGTSSRTMSMASLLCEVTSEGREADSGADAVVDVTDEFDELVID